MGNCCAPIIKLFSCCRGTNEVDEAIRQVPPNPFAEKRHSTTLGDDFSSSEDAASFSEYKNYALEKSSGVFENVANVMKKGVKIAEDNSRGKRNKYTRMDDSQEDRNTFYRFHQFEPASDSEVDELLSKIDGLPFEDDKLRQIYNFLNIEQKNSIPTATPSSEMTNRTSSAKTTPTAPDLAKKNTSQGNVHDNEEKECEARRIEKGFSCEQIAKLLDSLNYSKSKLQLIQHSYSKVHDLPQNYKQLLSRITFEMDRKSLKKEIKQYLNQII